MKRLAALLLVVLGGCSTFDRDWDAAASTPAGDPWIGRWEGTWHSDVNGHHGELRCIITRAEGRASARYHATYTWCVIPFTFEYTVPLTVVRDGDAWTSRGSAELGCWIAGGLYEYEGRAQSGRYVATYRSDFDHGIFRMKRVE